jgi:putative ABC transport system permease protein
VVDQAEFREQQGQSIDRLLALLTALLGLALLIAVLGLTNTLSLASSSARASWACCARWE